MLHDSGGKGLCWSQEGKVWAGARMGLPGRDEEMNFPGTERAGQEKPNRLRVDHFTNTILIVFEYPSATSR